MPQNISSRIRRRKPPHRARPRNTGVRTLGAQSAVEPLRARVAMFAAEHRQAIIGLIVALEDRFASDAVDIDDLVDDDDLGVVIPHNTAWADIRNILADFDRAISRALRKLSGGPQ